MDKDRLEKTASGLFFISRKPPVGDGKTWFYEQMPWPEGIWTHNTATIFFTAEEAKEAYSRQYDAELEE